MTYWKEKYERENIKWTVLSSFTQRLSEALKVKESLNKLGKNTNHLDPIIEYLNNQLTEMAQNINTYE